MKRDLRVVIAAITASGVVAAVACTFPEIGFKSSASGTGSGGTVAAATATSGSGGSGASTSSAGTGGSLPCGDAGPCDCDGDGDLAKSPSCDGGDCNDHDPLVNSKQTQWFYDAGSNGYDFNCSGAKEYEITAVLHCPDVGLICDLTTLKWHGAVPDCGVSGQYGTCQGIATACSEKVMGSKPQGCH